jgi:predicted secreted protein
MDKNGILLTGDWKNQMKVDGEFGWFAREIQSSTGYNWRFTPDNSGVYELTESVLLSPSIDAVGGTGMQIWKLKAVRSGTGTAVFELFGPGSSTPAQTVKVSIQVA